jgi:hypothetical protein
VITTWTTNKNSLKKKNIGAKQPFSHWQNFIKKKKEIRNKLEKSSDFLEVCNGPKQGKKNSKTCHISIIWFI